MEYDARIRHSLEIIIHVQWQHLRILFPWELTRMMSSEIISSVLYVIVCEVEKPLHEWSCQARNCISWNLKSVLRNSYLQSVSVIC